MCIMTYHTIIISTGIRLHTESYVTVLASSHSDSDTYNERSDEASTVTTTRPLPCHHTSSPYVIIRHHTATVYVINVAVAIAIDIVIVTSIHVCQIRSDASRKPSLT